jgi:hypothetical protein
VALWLLPGLPRLDSKSSSLLRMVWCGVSPLAQRWDVRFEELPPARARRDRHRGECACVA